LLTFVFIQPNCVGVGVGVGIGIGIGIGSIQVFLAEARVVQASL